MTIIDASAISRYQRDGYLVVENLFSAPEVEIMLDACDGGRVAATAWDAADADGQAARLSLWSQLGDDVWAAASTCPRIVDSLRALMGEELSFFHGKVIHKPAGSGGTFEWHQDYGYWYDQGFVFPRMASAWVALDPSTRANGCLEVLRGSHRLGRLNHNAVGGQAGADVKRLEQIRAHFEHVHCEMTPGSALFFDCNLLHGSGPNHSAMHRRSFIMCYNALANPYLVPGSIVEQGACPVSADDAILRHARARA